MAAMVPTSVEFHIHQVVPVFQISVVRNVQPKKRAAVIFLSATINNGIQAMNINGINEEAGHAKYNNNPDKMTRYKEGVFTKDIYCPKFGIKNKKAPKCSGAFRQMRSTLFPTIIRRLFCNINIMCMAFFHPCIGDLYKSGLL